MQIEAIYDKEQHKLVLMQPVQLKKTRVKVMVEFPDKEVVPSGMNNIPAEPMSKIDKLLEEVRAVLGPDLGYVDDGRTDHERFAEELEISGKYSS